MEFKKTWLASLIVLIGICLLLVQACGGGAPSETISQSGTGSLAVRANWSDGGDSSIGTTSGRRAASVDCQMISTVEAQVYWPDTDPTFQASGGPWACELGEGTVEKIPAKAGYTVVLVARDSEGHIIYRGGQDGVNVNDGQTTEVEITALPFRPQDPSPDNGTESNAVDLNWVPVEGAAHYEITISTNEELSDSTTYEAQSPPFSPPGLAGSTTYFWQVMAVDAFGNKGAGSEIRNFRLALGVPTLIRPEEGFIVTESEVTCQWSEIAGSTYHLYIATDMAMTNLAVDAPVDGTSYTFSDLAQDTAYYLQVCAVNASGPGNRSAVRTFYTFSGPELETPAQDLVLPKESVQLSWAAFSANDSLRYEAIISRSADMNDMGARVLKIETTDTYYTPDAGLLTDNQTYYWRVIAHVNDNPDGLPSPVGSFKTLGKPEARSPADGGTGFRAPFNFIWQAVNNGGGYRIVISPNSDLAGPMKNSVVSGTQFTIASGDRDLKYGVRYYWRVYALDSNGEQHDAYASTTRTYDLFGVPALTFPEHRSAQPTGGFNFQWQAVPGAVQYHILVRESGGEYTNPVIDQVVNTTSHAIPRYSLSGGVTYYWKVFAINGNQDEGADSAEFYFTTHDAMRITDINPNPPASIETADAFPTSLSSPELTAFMDHLFFVATNGDEYGLWMTDGTPEGVKRVGQFVYPRKLNVGVNGLFFVARESSSDNRDALWVITNPASGADIVAPPASIPYDYGDKITSVLNASTHRLFYSVLSESENRYKIWMVKYGSPMSVLKAGFADDISKKYSDPVECMTTSSGGKLFFQTWNTSSDADLWCSPYDYNSAQILTTTSGPHGYIGKVGTINQKFIFSAMDNNSTTHLWISDGTPAGTAILKSNISGIGSNTVQDGYLYFWAKDPSNGHDYYHLWKTNGTAAGTKPVASASDARIRSGGRYYGPAHIAILGNHLYFRWHNESVGDELYRSDGTYDGTQLIRDINTLGDSGGHGSTYDFIVSLYGNVYFRADGTSNNSVDVGQLWVTDGDGAVAIKLCNPYPCLGSYGNVPGTPVGANGDIFFPAAGDAYGRELWRHTP